MTDVEFVNELRRHIKAIIMAVFRRFGVDLIKSLMPSPISGSGPETHEELPARLVLSGDSPCSKELHDPQEN
jgi:hypothetical protein